MSEEKSVYIEEIARLKELASGFREQSYLWRMLSLIQVPATLVAVITAIVLYLTANIIVHVDPKPSPGYYLTDQVPDKEFVLYAVEFANLISTFNAKTAEAQFEYASKFLSPQFYHDFREKYLNKKDLNSEIMLATKLEKTQMFFIDKYFIRVKRIAAENPVNNKVEVRLYGNFTKFVKKNARLVTNTEVVLYVYLQTVPYTVFNPNGVVITGFEYQEPKSGVSESLQDELEREDKEETRIAKRKRQKVNFKFYSW
ncbi:MAG: hypothetical protein LBE20_06865 [Deltaproteobacteria bacterium]|jgi:hypothetical protein|nr:hypothetical protein [Deltaproteobacteria bacterium]